MKILVICPNNPHKRNGYGIASKSLINFLKLNHEIKVIYLFDGSEKIIDEDYHRIREKHEPKWKRFFLSLHSKHPASIYKYLKLKNQLIDMIENYEDYHIWIDDIVLGFLLFDESIQKRTIGIRSHDNLFKSFEGFGNQKNIFLSLLWKYELKRIKLYEDKVLRICTKYSIPFYPISKDEIIAYKNTYSYNAKGYIDFYIEKNNEHIPTPTFNPNLIFLGTCDEKKIKGLREFIDKVFLKLLKEHRDLKFYIAGKGSLGVGNYKNVVLLGGVEDSKELYNKGDIFINPQIIGSGIQIKNIDAIMNDKILITSKMASQGIPGLTKELIFEDFQDCFFKIQRILSTDKPKSIFSYDLKHFSKENFYIRMYELLSKRQEKTNL